jgi:hypothetical protein
VTGYNADVDDDNATDDDVSDDGDGTTGNDLDDDSHGAMGDDVDHYGDGAACNKGDEVDDNGVGTTDYLRRGWRQSQPRWQRRDGIGRRRQ